MEHFRSYNTNLTPLIMTGLPSLPKVLELPASKAEEDLAALFARLNSGQTAPVKHVAVSSSSPQLDTPPRSPAVATLVLEAPRATPAPVIEIAHDEDPEQRYLRKAAAYLDALPASDGTSPVTLMQNVAAMLRKVRRPLNLNASSIPNDTKRRYAQAVTDYINNTSGQADFLQMCAQLVADKVIAIDTLDEVDDLCHAIVEYVLSEAPKAPQAPTTAPEPAKAPSTPRKAATTSPAPIYKDPMIGAKVWPTQEKRDNVAGCRTVLLKGILIMNTVHKVQALVWGGKLESILVDPTKDFALVKFLTPEGCQKYFDATANGIELVYEGRKLAFLPERQPGPSSTNDVLKNCIDGEASRCIRAVDADEDWSDAALKILAEGKSKLKRELDCIKRGKTARGRFYIEFRFASIYSALNFKRALLDDVDWEHCNIQYAPDPCEVAHGVHLEDEDE
ncbi:hypothetical protein BDV96DRAFT_311280 [Lophiotrema nucula]|uniref:RRM domain-containing protein n=1 Tax=Lophiotrema nucula TaxID=690887 RepID=A0A6A5YIN9_9PLEO|nr:hypothetical protein BDV96DRAFT_311280 [Lophiotrema nucula]